MNGKKRSANGKTSRLISPPLRLISPTIGKIFPIPRVRAPFAPSNATLSTPLKGQRSRNPEFPLVSQSTDNRESDKMDMNSSMPMPPDLSDAGMNMSNSTVAYNFLQDILDYDGFQEMDQGITRAYWYGICIVIGVFALANLVHRMILFSRSNTSFSP
jgi:hypothetical protein